MTIFVLFSNVFHRISKRTHFALVVVVSFTYDCLRTVLNASGPLAAKWPGYSRDLCEALLLKPRLPTNSHNPTDVVLVVLSG